MNTPFGWPDERDFELPSPLFSCPRCHDSLTLHQPDPDLPERLLATCDNCKSWYVTDAIEGALIRIPALGRDTLPD